MTAQDRWLRNVALLPIQVLGAFTWLIAGGDKLLGGGVPAYFEKMFAGSFIAKFPGIPAAFYQIALLELAAGILFVVSLFRGEFLERRSKSILQWALWLSTGIFVMLGFGMRVISEHKGAADLYFYAGATVAFWIFVRQSEPAR
ncbi:MAG: hypothetical protein HY078_09340 [Elusimicrobia bacterium]|nr:hypothetical protein [Elusimicrobiota bacterium]